MDASQFDQLTKALSTWLSRRNVLKGIGATIAGGAIGRRTASTQNGQTAPEQPEPVETPANNLQTDSTDYQVAPGAAGQPEESFPSPTPTDEPTPTPTDTPTPTETPTPTDTPTPTETSTPTDELPAKETPVPTEVMKTAGQEEAPNRDEKRTRIAELCQEAADVLKQDVEEPAAFDRHPHPNAAFGFLTTLNSIALWGTEAETWDDEMLAHYVEVADVISLAIRVGADAYFELYKQEFPDEDFPDDPDTCIFRELAKWRESNAKCDPDDAVCRMSSFWNFTVLKSCRRCLRGF